MEASKTGFSQEMGEKVSSEMTRQLTPEDEMRTVVLEDDGEVFKANEGKTQFRALGL